MSIKTTCKSCGRELIIPDSFAKRQGKCPFCMAVLLVAPPLGPKRREQKKKKTASAAKQQPISTKPQLPPAGQPQAIRKPVIIGAAAAVLLGIVVAVIISQQGIRPRAVPPQRSDPHEIRTIPDPTLGGDQASEVEETLEIDLVAAGLDKNTTLLLEIPQPGQFIRKIAELPAWLDYDDARTRCDAVHKGAIAEIAHTIGLPENEVADIMSRVRTMYIAFRSGADAEWPVVVLGLDVTASRQTLFGTESSIGAPEATADGNIRVEEYPLPDHRRLYIGYKQKIAVIGDRYDVVHNVMRRMQTDDTNSLLHDEMFSRALFERQHDGLAWAYLSSEFLNTTYANVLELGDFKMLQAVIDLNSNKIVGTVSAGENFRNIFASLNPVIELEELEEGELSVSLLPSVLGIQLDEAGLASDTVLAARFYEADGVVSFTADANPLTLLAAHYFDIVRQRQEELERLRQEAIVAGNKRCLEDLDKLYDAIIDFVAKDVLLLQYPLSIAELIESGKLPDTSLLVCPLDTDPMILPNGTPTSFGFIFHEVRYRLTAAFSTDGLLAWELKPNHDGLHNVLYVSSEVRSLTPEELKAELERTRQQAQLRRIEVPKR